ncbi:MAG: hypothetical protein SGILL_010050, partial [Bacillariaceae sp.]
MINASGFHRPRRPAEDTITYLRGLPLNVEEAHKEVALYQAAIDLQQHHDDEDDEFPQNLAAALSALNEVRGEVASLAGDEKGSQSLEILAQIAAPHSEIAARCLLHACSGYCLHLATHRYGSHVLQTILQLSMQSLSKQDFALDEEAPSSLREYAEDAGISLPSLYDSICATVEELSPHSAELAVHLCGSHVLRTLLCVLSGVNLMTSHGGSESRSNTLRGRVKPKKKKRKRPSSSNDSSSPADSSHAGKMTIIHVDNPRITPTQFVSTLESLTHALLGDHSPEPGPLQQLACDASAGPLLIVLIRVLAYSSGSTQKEWLQGDLGSGTQSTDKDGDFRLGIAKSEPHYKKDSLADKVVKQILCWQDGVDKQEYAGDVIYGLSGETRGSHLLETLFQSSPDEFYSQILRCGDFLAPTSLQEYAEHDVSNFVLQTFLTTVRSKEQAESALKAIEKIISSGLAIDPSKRRRGLLWRATELASKFRVEQDGLLKAVRLGFLAVNQSSIDTIENTESPAQPKKLKRKQRKKASAVELSECVPLLISLKASEADPERITLDVAGSRAIYHMLRFSARLCEDVINGILQELSADDLVALSKDGLGSRCILDGILDGPVQKPIFAKAVSDLRVKLTGRLAELARHRVGHHVVRKLFLSLATVDEKEKVVEEILKGKNSLQGNPMGRRIIEA